MNRLYTVTVARRTVSQRWPQRTHTHEVFTPGVASVPGGAGVVQSGQVVMRHRDSARLTRLCCMAQS